MTLNDIVTLKSGLEVTQGHSDWYHLKAWCSFLFAFHSSYGSVLHHFRDTKSIGQKSLFFHTPLHSAPPLGGPAPNIAIPFAAEKPEWWC